MIRVLYIIIVCFFCYSCEHLASNIEPNHNEICDTNAIVYKLDIQPIIQNNCYECHSTAAIVKTGGGLDIEDTAFLRAYLKSDFRGDGIYGSKLFHCILHSQNALPMPPSYVLDTCSIVKIKKWLLIGAPFS